MNRQQRNKRFETWWYKNHHNSKGHVWLCKTARRVAYAYNLEPSAWETVTHITKRFNSSEYKRLSKEDARTLWRINNPVHTERLQRLRDTAHHLDKLANPDKPGEIWKLNR